MSTDAEIANALYGGTSEPTQAAPNVAVAPTQPSASTDGTPGPGDAQGGTQAAQEAALAESERRADEFFDGGRPVEAGQADSLLSGPFDPLLTQARLAGDAEAVGLLSEGRRQVAALFVEDGVGAPIVKDLISQFGDWHVRDPLSDDAIDALNERTMKALRQSWGQNTDRNISQAQTYLSRATQKMPWIADALDKGLGSQEGFIRAVYAASRSAARAASSRGRGA